MTNSSTRFDDLTVPPEVAALAARPEVPAPVVDQSVLDKLQEELDDDVAYTQIFVNNFVKDLPHKIERVRLALTTGDLEDAVTAVLSLKTSSQMVGAHRLAVLALGLETAVRSQARRPEPAAGLPRLAVRYLKPIKDCCRLTTYRLKSTWPVLPGGGTTRRSDASPS
jgi:HPt (histidine-containing phosphotransfer) domain-containing protein